MSDIETSSPSPTPVPETVALEARLLRARLARERALTPLIIALTVIAVLVALMCIPALFEMFGEFLDELGGNEDPYGHGKL